MFPLRCRLNLFLYLITLFQCLNNSILCLISHFPNFITLLLCWLLCLLAVLRCYFFVVLLCFFVWPLCFFVLSLCFFVLSLCFFVLSPCFFVLSLGFFVLSLYFFVWLLFFVSLGTPVEHENTPFGVLDPTDPTVCPTTILLLLMDPTDPTVCPTTILLLLMESIAMLKRIHCFRSKITMNAFGFGVLFYWTSNLFAYFQVLWITNFSKNFLSVYMAKGWIDTVSVFNQ